jgi:hypothetical protein
MSAKISSLQNWPQAQQRGCVLRRRRPHVVVRAPEPSTCNSPRAAVERRARVTTLAGLGAREALPTMHDWDATQQRESQSALQELSEATIDSTGDLLAQWDDDDDAPCFDN